MPTRLNDSCGNVVLGALQSRAIRHSLNDYRDCAEAIFSALLDESGSVLMESGAMPAEQSATLGALANGAFIAVRELGRRLGDEACEGLYHQGGTRHFHIAPLSQTTFLFTVFGNDTKFGIIRSALAKYGPALRDKMQTVEHAASPVTPSEGDLVLAPSDGTGAS